MVLAHTSGWPLALLAGAIPAWLYLHGVTLLERRVRRRWSRWRAVSFLAGCSVLALALSPGLDRWAGESLSGHMVQHLLLAMLAPILLVLAAPMTLLLGAVGETRRRRIRGLLRAGPLRVATSVAVATALHIGALYALYLTPLFALTTTSDAVHHLVHLHFVVAGYLFAWAVAGPDPAPGRPGIGWRSTVLVIAGGTHAFLSKLLYSRAPRWPSGASFPASEVELAARWMYYGGHLADLVLATALFTAWYRRRPRIRAARPVHGDWTRLRSGVGSLAVAEVFTASPGDGRPPPRRDRST